MKNSINIGTGMSSIIMVFIILIFTVFGVLSYTTALADTNLTEKTYNTLIGYYEADAKCEELLSVIDTKIYNIKKQQSVNAENYLVKVLESLKVDIGIENMKLNTDNIIIKTSIPINENSVYVLELKVLPFSEIKRYEVISRSRCSIVEWEEQEINIWLGE